jgi:hypothetical protein
MSKEQTPIEELIERIKEEKAEGILFDLQMLDELQEKEIRFIQAKVLEALEREKENLERMYLLGRYERGESDKKMDLIDTSKSVIDELLRNRSKTKI